jgi:hypothetical protein
MTAPVALASLFALVEGESEDRKKERPLGNLRIVKLPSQYAARSEVVGRPRLRPTLARGSSPDVARQVA